MRRRWAEGLTVAAVAALLVGAGWSAAGAVRGRQPAGLDDRPGLCWSDCATDSECEAAEAAAAEAIAFERAEAKAREEFAVKCAAGLTPCLKRR